ncbi:MAG: YlqD family protein [Armatimonadota bacterium]|nr:YlqD family protein [bacterium]
MGIIVKRPIRVKVVVTEQFKAARTAEIRGALGKLDEAGKRVAVQLESIARRNEVAGQEADSIRERLRAEQRKTESTHRVLLRELDRISSASIGDEYEQGVLEGEVELEVGDDFSRVSTCEIVVTDGKISEIRDGLCPEKTKI